MRPNYDPNYIEKHYDEYGETEWTRFHRNNHPRDEVNLLIHTLYLKQFVMKNDFVLDIGSGPGRFAIEMAKIGANIAIADISQIQLNLNKEKLEESGLEDSILWRKKLDVIDLAGIKDEFFDVAVCYGGALSYVFGDISTALSELIRVTKQNGFILFSVMSLIGTINFFNKEIFEDEVANFGLKETDRVAKTGELTGDISHGHVCKLYRWNELKDIISNFKVDVKAASASNLLSNTVKNRLEAIKKNKENWDKFLEWEVKFCADEGSINGGSHILVVLQKL